MKRPFQESKCFLLSGDSKRNYFQTQAFGFVTNVEIAQSIVQGTQDLVMY
jgi:hypothetical protein